MVFDGWTTVIVLIIEMHFSDARLSLELESMVYLPCGSYTGDLRGCWRASSHNYQMHTQSVELVIRLDCSEQAHVAIVFPAKCDTSASTVCLGPIIRFLPCFML